MDDPIMLSPQDIFNMFMVLCGAIITVSSAITVIVNLVRKTKEPDKIQNDRITKLEKDVSDINVRLEIGDARFKTDTDRVNELESNMRKTNKVIIEGLQALIAHAIDGNNQEDLKQSKKKLDEYLVNKL